VLEKIRQFRRLGDSLGLGENAYKLLARWGCNIREIHEIGNQAPTMRIRRWHDGKVLAEQPLMDMAGYIGHRGDYHDTFLKWYVSRWRSFFLSPLRHPSGLNHQPTNPTKL
jgi:salicylate hydroxylase